MDITSYILGKKAGGGGSQPTGTISITENGDYNVSSYANASVNVSSGSEALLIKDIEDGSDLSNYTFFIDTSEEDVEEIIDEFEGIYDLCAFGIETETEAHIYQIMISDGETLSAVAEQSGASIYYPNGAGFTVNNSHVYIINLRADYEDEVENYGIYVLCDLTAEEYYADVEIPSTYTTFSLADELSENPIWNCLKVIQLSETPWEVLSGTPGATNTYYTSTTAPSDSFGENGDLYFVREV